jgi:hypothetical protein
MFLEEFKEYSAAFLLFLRDMFAFQSSFIQEFQRAITQSKGSDSSMEF